MPNLDDMLTPEQMAEWFQLTPEVLMEKSRGRNPSIPPFRLNKRVIRFHVRTVIAKMASDAGVKVETISASFGIKEGK